MKNLLPHIIIWAPILLAIVLLVQHHPAADTALRDLQSVSEDYHE